MIRKLYASTSMSNILGEDIVVLPYIIGGIMTKTCYKCNQIKDLSDFYKKKANISDGLSGRCKDCDNKMKADWRKRNPEKVKAYENNRARRSPRGSLQLKLKNKKDRARSRKQREELSDQYICYLIRVSSKLTREDISDDLIEAYRLNLKLKRILGLTSKLKSST